MAVPELLDRLLRAHGPSGHEQLAFDVVRDAVGEVAEIETDSVGNLIAHRRGEGPLLALFAHLDVIGAAVAHIGDDGLIAVHQLGSWRANVAFGQRVEIRTKDGVVPGVIARKVKDNEKVEWGQLYVDIGAKDGDDARSKVRIGDVAVISGEPVEYPNGRVISRSMDNRLGCFVAFEVARLVAEAGGGPGDVAGVAVTQEEITFGGSRTTAYSLRPDVAIVVDVTFATDQPGVDEKELGKHKLGSGPVIGRGSTLDPLVFELLHAAGDEAGIPFTVQASARYTGTDADAFHISRGGIPTGVVSIPLRYMHSPVEMVQLDDVENTAKLIAAFAQKLTADLDFKR